jgi:hypothetical protein
MKTSLTLRDKKLMALAENRVVAQDIYKKTIEIIEEIKNKLKSVETGDKKTLEIYKTKLMTVYTNYFTAMKQIEVNNEKQK